MVAEAGRAASFAMLIATIVVLFNGLVVYYLSKRFKRGGGYYVYAFYSLTSRLGLETGWSYLLYALSYGGTLLAGGAYVLYVTTGVAQWVLALSVSILAISLVLAGVRTSATYALVMSTVEMAVLIGLSLFFMHESGWAFYDPISFPTKLAAAVIFGLGIPTGYGSIAPLGGEAQNAKTTIGRAAIAVLLVGGVLATLFFYGLGEIGFTGNLVDYILQRLGPLGTLGLGFVALSDGVMGGMAYVLAGSRTLKAMAEDRRFPYIFSKETKGRPFLAEGVVGGIFVATITLMALGLGIYYTFLALGALAGFCNILIHLSANFSLLRMSLMKGWKRVVELSVALVATGVSVWVLLFSLPEIPKSIQDVFFGWVILGFLYAEALDIISVTEQPK
ncbi:amino acid permease [Sulfodiicoccus acidiphilus]|uniref:Amino acid permease n=2 Tax=Sulfodiicoccus acidiphilus TaxID=1670455 RepID=A0A348B6T2_9CREN|nr:amino acid permease [Sulfodiicoccus acidiphilus]GGT96111.1 amino acid permease [Sulfodiicoccus acidiphilus]